MGATAPVAGAKGQGPGGRGAVPVTEKLPAAHGAPRLAAGAGRAGGSMRARGLGAREPGSPGPGGRSGPRFPALKVTATTERAEARGHRRFPAAAAPGRP